MAKDDYEVIVYKILAYFYGCLKRKITFDRKVFNAAIKKDDINDEYLTEILKMMQEDGLITGVTITRVWGGDYILVSEIKDIAITSTGITFLKENSRMEKVKKALKEASDIVSGLIDLLGL